jgi:hypothetical protein
MMKVQVMDGLRLKSIPFSDLESGRIYISLIGGKPWSLDIAYNPKRWLLTRRERERIFRVLSTKVLIWGILVDMSRLIKNDMVA